MSRFRVERGPQFAKSLAERCKRFERIEEYVRWLEWELERDPTLFADQLSPEWPRFARILGDKDVAWRCLVLWRIEGEKVVLEDLFPKPDSNDG